MANSSEEQPQTIKNSAAKDSLSSETQNPGGKFVASASLQSHSKLRPRLEPQTTVGECYEVIKPLKGDRDITTYVVRDKEDRQSSLLVLELIYDPELTTKSFTPEEFVERVNLVKKMSTHGQIPKLYSHLIDNSRYYIIYEYVGGEILASTMKSRQLHEIEIINLLQDMARIYDYLFRNRLIKCTFSPHNILKSEISDRYILGNFRELFFNPPLSRALTLKEQQSLFRRQLKLLAHLVISSLTTVNYEAISKSKVIPKNWYQKVNLSPGLQNILAKMIAGQSELNYSSLQQISEDFKPLLNIDRVLGEKYRLIRYLGTRNEVKTYLARYTSYQEHNSALFIVKQLAVNHHGFSEGQATLTAKIDALNQEVAQLQQLSVLKALDLIWEETEEGNELYFVRLYSEGISLSKKLNRQKSFSGGEIRQLLRNAAIALDKVHKQGLIHRNIKPSNLILTGTQQTVTLVDFGVLQTINDLGSNLGKDNKAVLLRQPPEQIVGRPTTSSDIYALGIVMVEVLAGLSIREFPQDSNLARSIWQDKLVADPILRDIINKMIAPEVDLRYQSVTEILADLDANKLDSLATNTKKTRQLFPKLNWNWWSKFSLKNLILAIASGLGILAAMELFTPTVRPQFYLLAAQQQSVNSPQIALKSFERALALKPESLESWLGKGDALLTLGEHDLALAAYQQAIDLDADSGQSWHKQGDAYTQLEDWQQALKSYKRALQLDPENSLIRAKKGQILHHLSRYPEALDHQEKALKGSIADIELISNSAHTALVLGKHHKALTLFNRVQKTVPQRPYLWQDKVIALDKLNRESDALATSQTVLLHYDKALEATPQNTDLWLGQAMFMQQLRYYAEALNSYQKAIAISQDKATAWIGKSKLLLELEEYQEAALAIEQALKLAPDSFIAWHLKGQILQKSQQDLADAVVAYDKAIAINQQYFPAWRDRSTILLSQNQPTKAIESLQKSVSLAPQDLDSWLNLAQALQRNQKIEEAVQAIDRAIVLQPRNSKFWLEKGSLWERNQQYDKACKIYHQAMEIAPDFRISGAMRRVGCQVEDS